MPLTNLERRWLRQERERPAFLIFLCLAGVALIWLLCGCTSAELDRIDPPVKEPPCDAQSPYACPDGHSCCRSWAPVCWGPDATGYYCETQQYDPDDPTHLFGSEHRERATPRTDAQ